MFYKYLSFSISIVFISFIVGLAVNAVLKKTKFYSNVLSHLNFVKSDGLNKWLGVGLVRWMVRNTPFKYLNPKLSLQNRSDKPDLLTLRKEMTSSEIDHLIGFLFVMFFAAAKFYKGEWLFGLTITGVNILMNLHPSLLHQQNKRRIDRIININAAGRKVFNNQMDLPAKAIL